MKYSIIPRLTVSCTQPVFCTQPVTRSQPVSHCSVDVVVLNSLHSHNYNLTNECSLSCRCASLQIDRFQVLLQSHSIIACKCISQLAQSWPPSPSLSSLNLGIQLHIQTRLITTSKCISKLAQSRPQSASRNSLDYGLPVHPQTRSVTASKSISDFTQSQPPSASPNSLDHGFRVYLSVHLSLAS